MNRWALFLLIITFNLHAESDLRECVKYLKDREGKVIEPVSATDKTNADACLRAHEACLKKKENLLRTKVYPADPGLFCSFEK